MAKQILHITLFLVGLLGVSAAIRSADVLPFWDFCRQKTAFLAREVDGVRELDRYDTLFVGSSRFHNIVMPELFDSAMAEAGVETHSFNLALRGLRMHDFDALIEWVIARRPARLKRVIVELYAYDQRIRDNSWMTGTQVEVHQARYLLDRLHSVLIGHYEPMQKMEIAGFVLAHTLANFFRVGQGPRILDDLLDADRGRSPSPRRAVADGGWEELDPARPPNETRARQHAEWRANRDEAEKTIAQRRQDLCPDWMKGSFNLDSCRRQVESLRVAGIELVYVVMPQISYGFHGRDAVPAVAELATVVELDDPNLEPELYDPTLWFDSNHMMKSGAVLLTRRLAAKMVAAKGR